MLFYCSWSRQYSLGLVWKHCQNITKACDCHRVLIDSYHANAVSCRQYHWCQCLQFVSTVCDKCTGLSFHLVYKGAVVQFLSGNVDLFASYLCDNKRNFFFGNQYYLPKLIIYLKKLFNSDWLRVG